MPPSSTGRDQLVLLLGELKEGLQGVKDDIAEMKKAGADERMSAAASRQRIYEKLEDGEQRITTLESTLRVTAEVVNNRLNAIEPTVAKSARVIRAWTIRGGIIMASLAAVGGFVWALVNFLWSLAVQHRETLMQLLASFFKPN